MKLNFYLAVIAIVFFQLYSFGQQEDSVKIKLLDSVIVNARFKTPESSYLPDVTGMNVYAGKKKPTALFCQIRYRALH